MTHRRDMSVTLTCAYCAATFHPWQNNMYKGHTSQFCSKNCRSKAILAKVNSGNASLEVTPIPVRDTDISITEVKSNAQKLGDNWRNSGEWWDKVATWYANRQLAERKRNFQKDQAYNSTAYEGKTITISGYGARLNVKGDKLIITHGRNYSTETVETELLYRGIHNVSTIVWLVNGGDGNVTMSAIKWISSQNITLRILTNHGENLATIYPSPNSPQSLGIPNQSNGRADIKLRRLQYALASNGKDVVLARQIILRKLIAQRNCLDVHPELPDRERGYTAIATAIEWLSLPTPTKATNDLNGIRLYEARAANGYYMSFKGLQLQVDAKASKDWPDYWKSISERKSPLTRWMSPQNAVNPFQAILNFAYGLLESQTRSALNAVGLDIVCGILHSDKYARDNLVYDILEPLRGEVDHLALEFIKTHVFSTSDFLQQNSGAISIHPNLCKVLVNAVKLSQRKVDEQAKWFEKWLLEN